MKKYVSILFSIFVLSCVAIGTFFWINAFHDSVKGYKPLLNTALLETVTAAPLTPSQVVVVIVSGLGQEAADQLELPTLSQIGQTGAGTVIRGFLPAYGQTSRTTLITGTSPESNGASPADLPVDELSLLEIDTIFSRAHQANLKTALLGPAEWRQIISRNNLDEPFFVPDAGPEADQLVFENALLLLNDAPPNLMVIHLTQLAQAARNQGGTSGAAYQQAAFQIDEYLAKLHQTMDYGRGVLVILGDHGYTESGGYGGAEPEITRQPLVMVGNRVAPGQYSDVNQSDVAPTLTTLLGIAPPTSAQGRILFEMLRLDEKDQSVAQLALAGQRVLLAGAYLAAVAGEDAALPDSLATDLAQAKNAFAQNNVSGAFQLARLAQETADTQLAMARTNYIRGEQWPRLPGSVFLLLAWAIIMWRRRGVYASLVIVATIITVALYHILFQLQGFEYSISAIHNFSGWPFSVARRITVSLLAGGGVILILLMLANEQNRITLLGTGYGFGVLVTFVFTLPLFWTFWQNGLTVTGYLPSVDVAFWQVTASFEAMISAMLGLVLPWPVTLLILFVNMLRRSLNKTQSRPERGALPGLHL